MQKLIFKNGNGKEIDLTAGNYGITNWSGLSNTGLNIQTQQVPFADGGVYLDALMNQREINVTVAIQDNNNLELRYQLKRELISALNPKGGEGVLIYQNDYLVRQIHAVPQLPIFENKNSNTSGTLKASVTFSCPDPYWEDLEETEVTLNASENTVIENNGDVPVNIKGYFNLNCENFLLKNETTKQELMIPEYRDWNIELDTRQGKKSISRENKIMQYVNGGILIGITGYNDSVVIVGTQIIIVDKMGNIQYKKIPETTSYFEDVIYSPEKNIFIVAGYDLYYSKDAENWKTAVCDNHNFTIVSYEDGIFKAKSRNNIYTSIDGINWEYSSTATIEKNKKKININNKYVQIGGTNNNPVIQVSNDNTNWTTVFDVSQEIGNIFLFAVIYNYGTYYFCGDCGLVITSKNLIDFNYNFIENTSSIISATLDNNNVYILSQFAMSKTSDFKSFNKISLQGVNEYVTSASGNGKTLVNSLGRIFYTNNGFSSYTSEEINYGDPRLNKLKYINNKFFLLPYSELLLYNNEGNQGQWITISLLNIIPDYYIHPIDIEYKDGFYYLLCYKTSSESGDTTYIVIKTDFENWTVVLETDNMTMAYGRGILRYANNTLVCSIYTGNSNKIYTSNNGSDWVSVIPPYNYGLSNDIIFYDGVWYIATSNMYILTTKNFVNFEKLDMYNIQDEFFVINKFIIKDMELYMFGGTDGKPLIMKLQDIENANIIDKLSANSDMNFKLDMGTNEVALLAKVGTVTGKLTFRQRYVGV